MIQRQKNYVAIDDSGDTGFKPGSSEFFAVAAVVFDDPLEAESVSLEIKKYKRTLGWRDDHEFKFNKMRRDLIFRFIEEAVSFDFKVYSLYVNKSQVDPNKVPKEWGTVYNQVILELLTRIPLHEAVIRIDGIYGKEYMRTTESYFRKELNKYERRIDNVKFVDSKTSTLIQLADIAAGSVNRSLQTNKTDSQDYIGLLRGKLELLNEFTIR